MGMETVEIKAFVPARDFALSARFYVDLGFTVVPESETMAFVHAGHCSFLLQKFYVKEHAENFMMHMLVVDVEAWWERVVAQRLAALRRAGRTAAGSALGLRDFCLVDPSSVLWCIAQIVD